MKLLAGSPTFPVDFVFSSSYKSRQNIDRKRKSIHGRAHLPQVPFNVTA